MDKYFQKKYVPIFLALIPIMIGFHLYRMTTNYTKDLPVEHMEYVNAAAKQKREFKLVSKTEWATGVLANIDTTKLSNIKDTVKLQEINTLIKEYEREAEQIRNEIKIIKTRRPYTWFTKND